MTIWLAIGLLSGAALALIGMETRRRRAIAREQWRAHVRAVAGAKRLADVLANTRIDITVTRGRR